MAKGFAKGSKEAQENARKGGKAAHAAGTAHKWTSEEARIAGKKGGAATAARKRAAKVAKESSDTTSQPKG